MCLFQINVTVEGLDKEGYDGSNALILPSKKVKSKVKHVQDKPIIKKLSKKQRKKLEKVVLKKEKKVKVMRFIKPLIMTRVII